MNKNVKCKAGLIIDLDRTKTGYRSLAVRCNKKEKHPRHGEHSYQGVTYKITWEMKNNGL